MERWIDVDENRKKSDEIVQFARVALIGDRAQTEAYVRRLSRSLKKNDPEAADALRELVSATATSTRSAQGTRSAPLVPVDHETRLDLLRIERNPVVPSIPLLAGPVAFQIEQLISERERQADLLKADLEPSRTILFTGPPGVGKTMTARWIAQRLHKPLFTLDLASVMSSLLGRTGTNLRAALDYAKTHDGVLLLDEFDAVAKRRNDDTEVGELKRLVTVLLQEIDLWPADQLLIAATNHGELLDPAIWRRFDSVVGFPLPTVTELSSVLAQELGGAIELSWVSAFAVVLEGRSNSDAVRAARGTRRQALLLGKPLESQVLRFIGEALNGLGKVDLKRIGQELEAAGVSQRQISDMTGLSRDTIRRARPVRETSDG